MAARRIVVVVRESFDFATIFSALDPAITYVRGERAHPRRCAHDRDGASLCRASAHRAIRGPTRVL
jgi:hypothetical protein